jgi:hypothetical protein
MPIAPGDLPGTPGSHWSGSMAERIEKELDALLVAAGKPATSKDDSDETRSRRTLFVAIARGVVRHLDDHAGSIVVRDVNGHVLSVDLDVT